MNASSLEKQSKANSLRRWLARRPVLPAALFYLVLTLLLYHDLLFSPHRVISAAWSDIAQGEYPGRAWYLPLLRHFQLPLWDPYSFSGSPFFTKSQVPLLYPGEWLGVFRPVNQSLNQTVALHTFLAGFAAFLWARARRIGYFGALTAGTLFMLCGPFYLHIDAGQVNDVTAMAWTPLIFLAADQILNSEFRRGFLLGASAFTMQLYASQPQYTYFVLLALALYLAIRLPRAGDPGRKFGVCAAACLCSFAIGAVELIPTLIQTGESIRGSFSTPQSFARMASLPPESLLTLVMPRFFGDMMTVNYFGRWWFWSTNVYFGVAGATLAGCGMAFSRRPGRRTCIAMAAAMLILCLGAYTPLYPLLYRFLPGFAMFRGMSKFAYLMALFLALLAGMGIDALFRSPKAARRAAAVTGILGIVLPVMALRVIAGASDGPGGSWAHFLHAIGNPNENSSAGSFSMPMALIATARCSEIQLGAAGGLFLLLTLLLLYAAGRRRRVVLLACFAVAEMFQFAVSFRNSFDVRRLLSPQVRAQVAQQPADDRALMMYNANVSQMLRISSINGYDSFQLRRYAEFMAATQQNTPKSAWPLMNAYPETGSPLLRIVRLGYKVKSAAGPVTPVPGPAPLPHVLLVDRVKLLTGRETILNAMMSHTFDPEREVILEQQPNVAPAAGTGPAGTVRITHQTSDYLDIDADLTRPAILLVTDAYSKYWAVTEHSGNAQTDYEVLPADYTLRAVPLAAGHHAIRLQYVAPAWKGSEAVTLLSLLGFLIYAGLSMKRTPKPVGGEARQDA